MGRLPTHATELHRADPGHCLQYVSGAGSDGGARSGHRGGLAWTESGAARHGEAIPCDVAAGPVPNHRGLFGRTKHPCVAPDSTGAGRLSARRWADDAPGDRWSSDGLQGLRGAGILEPKLAGVPASGDRDRAMADDHDARWLRQTDAHANDWQRTMATAGGRLVARLLLCSNAGSGHGPAGGDLSDRKALRRGMGGGSSRRGCGGSALVVCELGVWGLHAYGALPGPLWRAGSSHRFDDLDGTDGDRHPDRRRVQRRVRRFGSLAAGSA